MIHVCIDRVRYTLAQFRQCICGRTENEERQQVSCHSCDGHCAVKLSMIICQIYREPSRLGAAMDCQVSYHIKGVFQLMTKVSFTTRTVRSGGLGAPFMPRDLEKSQLTRSPRPSSVIIIYPALMSRWRTLAISCTR